MNHFDAIPPSKTAPFCSGATSDRPSMRVPTEEGFSDAMDALVASCEAGKWTLLAPDGRVWMNKEPMVLFAALAAIMRGETLNF